MRAYALVFLSVVLAEVGDKTQLAESRQLRLAAGLGFAAIGVWMRMHG
jgi:putative Ca2+/H+ antiporter (TMEM165/GDT1 family)